MCESVFYGIFPPGSYLIPGEPGELRYLGDAHVGRNSGVHLGANGARSQHKLDLLLSRKVRVGDQYMAVLIYSAVGKRFRNDRLESHLQEIFIDKKLFLEFFDAYHVFLLNLSRRTPLLGYCPIMRADQRESQVIFIVYRYYLLYDQRWSFVLVLVCASRRRCRASEAIAERATQIETICVQGVCFLGCITRICWCFRTRTGFGWRGAFVVVLFSVAFDTLSRR